MCFTYKKNDMTLKNNFFILTGGPGSGKTTLIEQLKNKGYNCVPEVGRIIIKEQLSFGGTALPWSDVSSYSEQMLHYSLRDYISLSSEIDVYFFDRGIPDVLGYTALINLPNQHIYIDCVKNFRYNPMVLILPPWEDIYQTDAERKQDFKVAISTYNAMIKIYEKYDYKLVEVPRMTIPERINFILERVKAT